VFGTVSLVTASGASADTAVSTTTPIFFDGLNPCTDEYFAGNGNLRLLVSGNLSTGGMAQSHIEANLQGLQAVTIPGGKKYVVPDTSSQTLVLDTTDVAPFHETFEFLVQFIRQGEDGTFIMGDDFYEHFLFHATVNANGTVTVNDFSDDSRCQ
jgi:hypothetical protein